jgi:hypothetical protein
MRKRPAISERYPRMPKPPRTKTPSAVFWGVYEVTPEGLDLVGGIGRNREDAIDAAARAGLPAPQRESAHRCGLDDRQIARLRRRGLTTLLGQTPLKK